MTAVLTLELASGVDVVKARRQAREIASTLGFGAQDQVRIATAVSEIARNAIEYGGSGEVGFHIVAQPRHALAIEVTDRGPGFTDLDAVLEGRYVSPHGMGVGISGSRRLMDEMTVSSTPGEGSRVYMVKYLPAHVLPKLGALPSKRALTTQELTDELRVADGQLVQALSDLTAREDHLVRVNRELEETNRGVVALYAELDEKAASLKRAGELKTRFLSNMTHEFRTPVNALLSLADMLTQELDGPLNAEQKRQVGYMRRAAQTLQELVNDLLDLAKVEAGKAVVRAAPVSVSEVMATLRGMLRGPAAQNSAVQLVVEDPSPDIRLITDESKVSQILRNLVSNALKFTDTGEVRVSATSADNQVIFVVADTGVGIRPEDQARIFDEFEQIETPSQKKHRGTGLGLPLSRSLATLLGGALTLHSEPGRGSTFRLELPFDLETHRCENGAPTPPGEPIDPTRVPVLVLESDVETRRVIAEVLASPRTQLFIATTLDEARAIVARVAPALVVMDVLLANESAWDFIAELRRSPSTGTARIAVLTAVENEAKVLSLGADAFALKPADPAWLSAQRDALPGAVSTSPALVIDDDEIARYLTTSLLTGLGYAVEPFSNGAAALERARSAVPEVIVLDLFMPDMTGFAVLELLASGPSTAHIPVIVHTSAALTPPDIERIERYGAHIVPKHSASREESAARFREALAKVGARLA